MRAGELFEVSDGGRQAIVSEQGASLVQVRWDGTDLLNTLSEDGFAAPGCHGQVLAPWPGRIADGCYEYEGVKYRLPIDEPATSAAIHGLARWATWQVKDQAPGRLTLWCRLLAIPGYPFPLELEQSYCWEPEALEVAFTARNIGQHNAPFGYGSHPYFSVGTPEVDSAVLHVPANKYVPGDERLNAAGPAQPVDGTPWDFRKPRPIGDIHLDLTLADLVPGEDGAFSVTLSAPDDGLRITCRYWQPVQYLQLYSGDTLPFGKRQGLAIEPYTCVPNAFNNNVGLIALHPGQSVDVRWSISAAAS